MKTLYTGMVFIVLLLFTPRVNKIPELKQTITIQQDTIKYSSELIESKIDTLERTKQRVIQLQKELGFRK
jgi:hypothetical protein